MFKLESYITPVILSYVEKYVKNFKPEQSQVSLWGGDASFQNLDLRLEVLEEQLHLPFTFVSGHIHELLIHVPWVKITSEPIVITINTIECILKLKDDSQSENISPVVPSKPIEIPQEDAPQGYIKSIVTKVINNITINCNNLILKYVEEDIVLSINVRFLSIQTVNEKWEPAFTDINSYEVKLQKLIKIQDLTLCLDKMDTCGKIEIYQDPVLYRCSMTIRLIMNYHNNTAKQASITRLDLHCQKMEFSITEQQIPMILRLMALLSLLQSRQLPTSKEKLSAPIEESDNSSNDEHSQVNNPAGDLGWGMWAWNTMSSILPMDWDSEWSNEQHLVHMGHVVNFGFYIDDATITFKTAESVKEQLFYKSRKIKYKSFLTIRFTEAIFDAISQGMSMTNFTIGFGSIRLYPRGTCSCGHLEVIEGAQPPLYLATGKSQINYLKDTLFDSDAIENQGKKRLYKKDVAYHLESVTVPFLMQKSPAFCMDYIHYVEIPDNITAEDLSRFGSSYEYSNFREERYIRYGIGNLTVRLNSGLFHRINTIKEAADQYDYTPYATIKQAPTFDELPPVTVEEYEALRENIPMIKIELLIINSAIQFQFADHRVTGLPRQRKYIEDRTIPLVPVLSDDPYVSVEVDKIAATIEQPLYPFRLVACASKQNQIPPEMLSQCYKNFEFQIQGVKSQLHLKPNLKTSIMMPCNIEYNIKMLLHPEYWENSDTKHHLHFFKIDGLTITGTKAKIMVANSIVLSLLFPEDSNNPVICSSLYTDSCEEKSPTYLEFTVENITLNAVICKSTRACAVNIGTIKIFAHDEYEQAFILSGPETHNNRNTSKENPNLLSMVIQLTKSFNNQKYPAILSFQVSPMKSCLDPLLFQWLSYKVTHHKKFDRTHSIKSDTAPPVSIESAISDGGSKKKTFPSLHESVHSSSDKEKKKIGSTEKSTKKSLNKTNDSDKIILKNENFPEKKCFLNKLVKLHPWWHGLVLKGFINHTIIYIPSKIMSGIGAEGIEEAKNQALKNDPNLQILVIKSPVITIHSSNINSDISSYFHQLPVILPKSIWTFENNYFPWTFEILNFECNTLKSNSQQNFIKKICFKATFDVVTKENLSELTKNKISTTSLNLYIETSSIVVSLSEDQIRFLRQIFLTVANIFHSSTLNTSNKTNNSKEVKDVSFVMPRSSSSPTQFLYPEDATTASTISTIKESAIQVEEDFNFTAFIQWTVTKVALKLYVLNEEEQAILKLVLELEDIITSVEIQSVYFKLKHKITTATIFHYKRNSPSQQWDYGDFVGLMLCGREDQLEKNEESGFINITLTIAKSGNVHTRWGALRSHKALKIDHRADALQSTNSYITEALVKIQMIDIILPVSVLAKYVQIVKPFLNEKQSTENPQEPDRKNITPPFIGVASLRSESLPLIYLEFKGFRFMLPVDSENFQHDLLMVQVDGVRISPHAENPICRVPFRSDIYQLAAQANILNIPGSAVEDRQYQINVDEVCVHTTTWKDYQKSVAKRMSQSYLYTMNENPAVEWNKLGSGSCLESHFSTLPIISRFDFSFIVAPAVIFKPSTMVCASAAEINCMTDLEILVNLDQIKLISALFSHFTNLLVVEELEKFETLQAFHGNSKEYSFSSDIKCYSTMKQVDIDYETDYKDSGIEFEYGSSNSTNVEKSCFQETSKFPPFEFLINCGKITITMYDIKKKEIVTNISENEEKNFYNCKQPLIYIMINQPNLYFSQQQFQQKIQVSCFDISSFLGDQKNENLVALPTDTDYPICLVETKSGEPHPDTGIPPSFLVIKYELTAGKNPKLYFDMGRPTKLHFSISRLNDIIQINDKILDCFTDLSVNKLSSNIGSEFSTPRSQKIVTKQKYDLPDLTITTKQLVFSVAANSEDGILFSVASLSANLASVCKPKRIYTNINWESFVISTIFNSQTTVLLSPWSCNATVTLLWESWQNSENSPYFQIQMESDCIYMNIGPKHIISMKTLFNDYKEILNKFYTSKTNSYSTDEIEVSPTIHEQHYKDDLKSGAFQFIDGSAEELPFPYQVVFFSYPQQAMAWRYPHPRALTRIHVSPVPMGSYNGGEAETANRVSCALEYWSDSQMAYQRYVEFYVSETDGYRLDLPEKVPLQAASYIWRIVFLSNPISETSTVISSKALIACLRIDSYFNPLIVPCIQAAINISSIKLSLYNHLEQNYYSSLPAPLNNYELNGMIPETQCFAILESKETNFLVNKWPSNSLLLNLSGSIGFNVLDYGLLIMQEILDFVKIKIQLSTSDESDLSLSSDFFSLKISPSIFHTISTSIHLWNNLLSEKNHKSIVLTTKYIIANNTNISIRFGQSGTDDNILLESRQCHFYSWRHANNQVLRISIEENGWSWSKSFSVNIEGFCIAEFHNSDISISVNVSSLSASQKLITFSGQLIISNQLIDNFEMKLVKYDVSEKNKSVASRETFQIHPSSQPPSIVLTDNNNIAMRLRFSNIPNLSWTGDIPLQPNMRWGQPWLVKVPLQERGQFISIWVRVIIEVENGKNKILAILSPLYLIRSYLPVPAKVQIETPSLKVTMNTVIKGRGESQQLYCPGTYEHFHQLTFQIESGVSASNPYVPLSYSSVDQRKFFKRPEKENINDILATLETLKEESKWPFQNDESYSWTAADQPQTHVQVKYEDAGLASSTLLLELQPWCFILNSLGTQLSLVSQDLELCKIPHYGIVAPPKLEGTFYIGIGISEDFFMSSALQLVKSDWSQGFYMPRIEGLIPLEGNIKTCVDCISSICIMSIDSNSHKDMRIIRIKSNYVIGNMTDYKLDVATVAVPSSSTNITVPNDLYSKSMNIPPSKDSRIAIPIVQWYTLYEKTEDPFILYILLRFGVDCKWSCPVRVDQSLSRRCVALPYGNSTIPLVVTTQDDQSTIHIMIHIDQHPQLFIENKCSFMIFVGQTNEESDNIIRDAQNFSWKCQIDSKNSCHYSMPSIGNRLPDLPNTNNNFESIFMSISALPITEKSYYKKNIDENLLHWSKAIDLSTFPEEQVVRLPYYGDVKLTMQTKCYTTYLCFTPISQIEVSAQEIRSKIEKKSVKQSNATEEDHFFNYCEEDFSILNPQSTCSSSSTTTFFSAQDEISETDVSSCTAQNKQKRKFDKSNYKTVDTLKGVEGQQRGSIAVHFQGFSIILLKDVNENAQRLEVASLSLIDTIVMVNSKNNYSSLNIYVGDLQLDNQMFEYGGYDFPVVLLSQKPFVKKKSAIHLSGNFKKNIKHLVENSLLGIDLVWENDKNLKVCKEVLIKIAPITAYIEGTYITLLMDFATSILPPCFIVQDLDAANVNSDLSIQISNSVHLSECILVDAKILSHPLRLQSFIIEPLSILLSVHTSVHLYVAFDHSPLYFEIFDRKNLMTTPYRLGNSLAMHYLSGAIFGVGWVVGSLEILGSPGGLAQALGTGIKDFVSMPFQGLLQGPWGFVVGITHGSASLVKHVTAGTVNSVTKLASSVARNLDRLTLDDEHLQRQEEFRRMRPQGVAQGLYQGLTGFGMSLLAAVAGLAHHPLQQVWSGETSTRGIVTGVGLGLVGAVTKPLSGAAELVARTGQGLLQGTGWISLPSPRQRAIVQYSNGCGAASLRYAWRLMPLLEKSHDSILHVSCADHILLQSTNRAVILVLTKQALLILNVSEDSVEKIIPLKDLTGIDHPSEPNMFRLIFTPCSPPVPPPQIYRKLSQVDDQDEEIQMDQEMRARVAEFLRTSSTGIASVSSNSEAPSEAHGSPIALPDSENSLNFFINYDFRSYLISVLNVAKRQNQDQGFQVI